MDVEYSKGAIKKQKVRKFNNAWLHENIFKGWLAPHPVEDKAFCMLCNKTIRCCKTNLVQHSQSVKHIEKVNGQSQSLDNDKNTLSFKDKVKRAEIKLAALFAEHNIAFQIADHLVPLLKDICIELEVVESLSLGATKCTNIVKEVIAKREVEKIVNTLRTRRFSILIDESTGITDTKFLCVLVKYVSLDKEIKTQLLELLALDATDCSANKLFEAFKTCLEEKNIPIKNIIGMASDNASVMTGCHNSFFTRLKSEVPEIILLNCICHSFAIVASKACEKLPQACEDLIRGVATYISGSAKRCAILGEFQDFFNVERNKILKLCNTRWLVLHKCVTRLLENWNVLKNYFIFAVVEDKLQSADIILQYLHDNNIKAYLLFLKYSLNFFNNFNALFQSRKILIHKLFNSSVTLIRQIAQNFIVSEALSHIVDIDIDDIANLKDPTDICVGPDRERFLEAHLLQDNLDFRLKCLDFYKTAFKEMLKRLPIKESMFEQLTFLGPKNALYEESRNKFKNLSYFVTRIGHLDESKLAFEWNILPTVFDDSEKQELASLEIDKMWKRILECENLTGKRCFQI